MQLNDVFVVYDDYKFLTRSELDGLGLSHLIGTDFVRAYMHGFFLDIRLYRKVSVMSCHVYCRHLNKVKYVTSSSSDSNYVAFGGIVDCTGCHIGRGHLLLH